MRRQALALSGAIASARRKESVGRGQRQEHPILLHRQGRKSVSRIKATAPLDLLHVSTIEDVEHDNDNSQIATCSPDAFRGIDKKVGTISLPLKTGINADHRDERRWDLPMARSSASVTGRKIPIVDRKRIEGIIANQAIVGVCQDEHTQVTGLRQLVGRLAQTIINLVDTSCKGCAIVARDIERFDPQRSLRAFTDHWLEIVR